MDRFKIVLLIIISLISLEIRGQELNVDRIYGTWEGSETKVDESLLLLEESGNKPESGGIVRIFFFQENGFVDLVELEDQFKLPYSIKDSILSIGNNLKYKILDLQRNHLTLKTIGIFEKELNLKKKGKDLQPIPPCENIQTYYTNGRKKLQGLKEYGSKKGIWTEWYQDGQVKQVELYENHMPIMTIIFDTNGYILSKRRFDFNTQTFKEE